MSFNPQNLLQNDKSYTQYPIDFNIVGIVDISSSKLSQIDKWKDFADPHKASADRINKGRNHLIRELREDTDTLGTGATPSVGPATPSSATYKLTLKDQSDNYCFAYEFNDKLPFLRQRTGNDDGSPLPIPLGGRLRVEKGTMVQNGVLMLNRAQCRYLGLVDEDKDLYTKLNSDISAKYMEYLRQEIGG